MFTLVRTCTNAENQMFLLLFSVGFTPKSIGFRLLQNVSGFTWNGSPKLTENVTKLLPHVRFESIERHLKQHYIKSKIKTPQFKLFNNNICLLHLLLIKHFPYFQFFQVNSSSHTLITYRYVCVGVFLYRNFLRRIIELYSLVPLQNSLGKLVPVNICQSYTYFKEERILETFFLLCFFPSFLHAKCSSPQTASIKPK